MIYLIFALLGLGLEVVVTAITARNKKMLVGYSSLWYALPYSLIPIYFQVAGPIVFNFPWYIRGLIYVAFCHVGEFFWMVFLRLILGETPSQQSYKNSWGNIKGFTGLSSTPFFFIGGLFIEWIYRFLR